MSRWLEVLLQLSGATDWQIIQHVDMHYAHILVVRGIDEGKRRLLQEAIDGRLSAMYTIKVEIV